MSQFLEYSIHRIFSCGGSGEVKDNGEWYDEINLVIIGIQRFFFIKLGIQR